jgi:cell division transport system ATP-binding protein
MWGFRSGFEQNAAPVEIVSFERVALAFPGHKDIFQNVSFVLQPGSFHFLTGGSGSGKTSLLKLICLDYLSTSKGHIRLFGRNSATLRPGELPILRQKMGIVFQEFCLLDHLTVAQNVSLPLILRGVPLNKAHEQAIEMIRWVGLYPWAHALPPTLSGGQKQRVAIARAVIARPALLLADEPTGSVDSENAIKILYLFEELNKMGTTVLIATHDRHLAGNFPYPELEFRNKNLIYHPARLKKETLS